MPTIAATVTHATNTQQNPFAHGTDTLIMEPAASRPSMVMQHNIRSTESHELPEAIHAAAVSTHCHAAALNLMLPPK